MKHKPILRLIARIALLFLSLCGIATIITHYIDPAININNQVLQTAWTFGIGGSALFILSFFRILGGKH